MLAYALPLKNVDSINVNSICWPKIKREKRWKTLKK
jgi:hypothetical protein